MWYFTAIRYFLTFVRFIIYPFKLLVNKFRHTECQINTKIIGTGIYTPTRYVNNTELLGRINRAEVEKRNNNKETVSTEQFITNYYGVSGRYIASENETHSFMAYNAVEEAICNAQIDFQCVDCIIYASAGMDKLIPDTSVYIHEKLCKKLSNKINHNPPSFTVHSTCISALHGLNIANTFIKSGQYKTIVVVSAEKTSVVANIHDPKTCAILGDMATAVIVQATTDESRVTNSKFKTYSTGLCDSLTVEFGSINQLAKGINHCYEDFTFTIKYNKNLIKIVPTIFADFVSDIIFADYDYVVIHQPSKIAVDHVKEIFGNKTIESFEEIGNCASCSILYNLHKLINSEKLKRGDNIMLIGMGAGLGAGYITLKY